MSICTHDQEVGVDIAGIGQERSPDASASRGSLDVGVHSVAREMLLQGQAVRLRGGAPVDLHDADMLGAGEYRERIAQCSRCRRAAIPGNQHRPECRRGDLDTRDDQNRSAGLEDARRNRPGVPFDPALIRVLDDDEIEYSRGASERTERILGAVVDGWHTDGEPLGETVQLERRGPLADRLALSSLLARMAS